MSKDTISSSHIDDEIVDTKESKESLLQELERLYPLVIEPNEKGIEMERLFYEVGMKFFNNYVEDGHFWCKFPTFMQVMLGLFSIQASHPNLDKFCKSALNQLLLCAPCIDTYHTSITHMLDIYTGRYEVNTVELFRSQLLKFDRNRLEAALKNAVTVVSGNSSILLTSNTSSLLYAMYEICAYPELLYDSDIHTRFAITINLMVTGRAKTFTMKKVVPGILLSLISPQKNVRLWATRTVQSWFLKSSSIEVPTIHNIPSEMAFPCPEYAPENSNVNSFNFIWKTILQIIESGLLVVSSNIPEGVPLYPAGSKHFPLTRSAVHFFEGLSLALKALKADTISIISEPSIKWYSHLLKFIVPYVKHFPETDYFANVLFCYSFALSQMAHQPIDSYSLLAFGIVKLNQKSLEMCEIIVDTIISNSYLYVDSLFHPSDDDSSQHITKLLENYQLKLGIDITSSPSSIHHWRNILSFEIVFSWQDLFLTNLLKISNIFDYSNIILAICSKIIHPLLHIKGDLTAPPKFVIQSVIIGYRLLSKLLKEFSSDDALMIELIRGCQLDSISILDARCQRFNGRLAHPLIASLASSIISSILSIESKNERKLDKKIGSNRNFWDGFMRSINGPLDLSHFKNHSLSIWLPEIHHAILAYISNIQIENNPNIDALTTFYQRLLADMNNQFPKGDIENLQLIYISSFDSKLPLFAVAVVNSLFYEFRLTKSMSAFYGRLVLNNSESTPYFIIRYILENQNPDALISTLSTRLGTISSKSATISLNIIRSLWTQSPENNDISPTVSSPSNLTKFQHVHIFLFSWKVLWSLLKHLLTLEKLPFHLSNYLCFVCNLFRHILTIRSVSLLLPLPGFEDITQFSNDYTKFFLSCEWFTVLLSFIRNPMGDSEKSLKKRLALELVEDLLYWWTERRALFSTSTEASTDYTVIHQLRILLTSSGRLDETERTRLTSLLNAYLQLYPLTSKPLISSTLVQPDSVKFKSRRTSSIIPSTSLSNIIRKETPNVPIKRQMNFTSFVESATTKKLHLAFKKNKMLYPASLIRDSNIGKKVLPKIGMLAPLYTSKRTNSFGPHSQIRSKSSFISSRLNQVRSNLLKDTILGARPLQRRIAHDKTPAIDILSSDDDDDRTEKFIATNEAILAITTSVKNSTPSIKHKSLGVDTGLPSKPIQIIDQVGNISSLPLSSLSLGALKGTRSNKPLLEISSLQRKILSWDLKHITESIAKDEFTSFPETIPEKFSDAAEYIRIFEPLLLLECRAQIFKSIEELGGPAIIPNNGFRETSDWREYVLGTINMIDDFYDIRFTVKPNPDDNVLCGTTAKSFTATGNKIVGYDTPLMEHDLVYLEPIDRSIGTSAIVLGGTIMKGGEISINIRLCPASDGRWVSVFREGSAWWILKVTQLVTVVREYLALGSIMSSSYLPYLLNPFIINDKKKIQIPESLSLVRKSLSSANFLLNESQLEAISAALQKDVPISLIQGPPGTGKTTTILALVYFITNGNLSPSSGPIPVSLNNSRVGTMTSSSNTLSTTNSSSTRPILICAPSNAAVDEIVKRFLDSPAFSNRSIIRIGSQEVISDSIRHVSLDALLDESEKAARKFSSDTKSTSGQFPELLSDSKSTNYNISSAHLTSNDKTIRQKVLESQINEARSIFSKAFGSTGTRIEDARSAARTRLLQNASVIASTLSGSGHEFIFRLESIMSGSSHSASSFTSGSSGSVTFDTIIIDEACQAVELSTLIPLRYSSKRVILVGDPNQLPPTVLSKEASSYTYEQSLFTRIQKNIPSIVNLLSVQYRMHPSISHFPSIFFYNSRLTDGPEIAHATNREWHQHPLLGPYLFFDVKGQESKRDEVSKNDSQKGRKLHSLSNTTEAEVVIGLIKLICSEYPLIPFADRIGVISPYRDQVRTIKRLILKYFGPKILKHVEVNTVDGFQGQEKEIIIFSCVRASHERSIGFLRDTRRLNVALTRAKCSLFIIGHSDVLSGFPIWDHLIKDAKNRKVFIPFSGLHRWKSLFSISTKNIFSYTTASQSIQNHKMDAEPIQVLCKQQQLMKNPSIAIQNKSNTSNKESNIIEDRLINNHYYDQRDKSHGFNQNIQLLLDSQQKTIISTDPPDSTPISTFEGDNSVANSVTHPNSNFGIPVQTGTPLFNQNRPNAYRPYSPPSDPRLR